MKFNTLHITDFGTPEQPCIVGTQGLDSQVVMHLRPEHEKLITPSLDGLCNKSKREIVTAIGAQIVHNMRLTADKQPVSQLEEKRLEEYVRLTYEHGTL